MGGKWLEEFEVGQVYEHEVRRTVTEADNIWFSTATCNPAAIHIDFESCKGTEFGQPLVNSIFTLGLVVGLSVQETTLGTTIANLGMTEAAFRSPSSTATRSARGRRCRPCATASRGRTPESSPSCIRASTNAAKRSAHAPGRR